MGGGWGISLSGMWVELWVGKLDWTLAARSFEAASITERVFWRGTLRSLGLTLGRSWRVAMEVTVMFAVV